MNTSGTFNNTPVRSIDAKAELYNGSALAETYTNRDSIVSITIDRVGEESKFFGFGVCQKVNVKLRDIGREIEVTTEDAFKIYFNSVSNYPTFHIKESHRDENTNQLSITAYDKLYNATNHTVSELGLSSYTLQEFAIATAAFLGISAVESIAVADGSFSLNYPNGANFDGTETLKEALDAIAEATQTIYYINSKETLVFKRLSVTGAADLTIGKADYITLDTKTNRRLAEIVSATELGDNISATTGVSGTTQYVRNNPFWELREDLATLLETALTGIGGLTINQFECNWRGNYLLEVGDKIALVAKDNSTATSFVINDTIEYNGAFAERTSWNYTDNEAETATNPTSIGEALKQTFARVDKANKEIEMLVSEVDGNNTDITSLKLTTDGITASVASVKEEVEGINESVNTLSSKVDLAITENDVTIAIQKELENGVDKVATGKGFTFDDTGLTIEDLSDTTNNTIKTTITNNGMTVYGNEEEVLVANDRGVQARNLHANTYLIIGTNSRFEDYGSRTGCFWIGG